MNIYLLRGISDLGYIFYRYKMHTSVPYILVFATVVGIFIFTRPQPRPELLDPKGSIDFLRAEVRRLHHAGMIVPLFQDYDQFKITQRDYIPLMKLILGQIGETDSELWNLRPPFVETLQGDLEAGCRYFVRFDVHVAEGDWEYAHYLCEYCLQ